MILSNEKQERVPQAPRAPLPELAEFLAPLRVPCTQGPSAETLRQSLSGLLSEQPNKNCDTWAETVPKTKEQQFTPLLTDMVWDENSRNRQRSARLRTLPSEGEGVLICEDSGCEKQGRPSVGVARQYTGTAGKLTNCQGTVTGQYAERTRAGPVATRRYLPREWADAPERRQPAHGPAAVGFQTKAERALARLEEANRGGVRQAGVTGDAEYGDTPNFLNGREDRQDRHVVAVRANFSVTLGRGTDSPVRRADDVRAAHPRRDWQTSAWSAGAKGWGRAKFLARRCGRVAGEGTRHGGWLSGHRPGRGPHGEGKYCWSAFPATAPLAVLVEYAPRRHGVEQSQEEAKTELGWDHYQGRRWDGFPRQALTVRLSYSFLVWLEGRARESRKVSGRPRAVFSPSSRPPLRAPTGGPSPGERMAAL